ncbi:hypothetical protein [Salinimicrobium sp. TH3]|uniref:hypothetical protein n=1 Tax=Salinimicrobium sp. TH3 TaxID=2997342 RepID=UPI002273F91E|nr:hypothetical protein [Salinimicrobium sp. TH3]MCY2688224.1 hypothetical protein [Salinimicrobium sp. TH3]
MKKFLVLIVSCLILGSVNSFAQENFKFGGNIGIPVGDADIYDINYGADAAYFFEVSEGFSVGPMIGFTGYSVEGSNISFLPVAATGRYQFPASMFFLGADLGYAISLEDGVDGGFFYRPKVGYNFGLLGVIASYSGISVDGGTWSSINLGVEFSL